jgi:small GTP-binding protein
MLRTSEFEFDVFLSHSAKDKAVVQALAERLNKDGLRVWFDLWRLQPGDNIPAKIEEGLENSQTLVLCMSANAFGSDWAQLEAGTFRFRDPLNKQRRFIPLRLDRAPIRGSLAQFLYVDWRPKDREREYPALLEACRRSSSTLPARVPRAKGGIVREPFPAQAIQLDSKGDVITLYSFSSNGRRALTCSSADSALLWDINTGRCLRELKAHTGSITSVAWSPDNHRALSGSTDQSIRLWDVESARCLRVLKGHTGWVSTLLWAADQHAALSGSTDGTLRLWDLDSGHCVRVFNDYSGKVTALAWSNDQRHALSAGDDRALRYWNVETGRCMRVLEGHTAAVQALVWCADQRRALSGADDDTIRLWDIDTGRCLRVLEGHTNTVCSLALNADQRSTLSGSRDGTARLWDIETGRCLRVLDGHNQFARIFWKDDHVSALSGDSGGAIRFWNLAEPIKEIRTTTLSTAALPPLPDQVQYTNAKVLLVGESGAGKTGLSKVLAGEKWQPTDSTVGAWATQWKLPVTSSQSMEREIWLWDFGGQADQRLIHQLYIDETALAVLVFDGQKENLFEVLGQWDRDITRASRTHLSKLLVAGRIDTGGLRVSRVQIEVFARERAFAGYLETSAKVGTGCKELKKAILNAIKWEEIPWRSSPILFKLLKDELIRLRDADHVLMRFNELREALRLRMSEEHAAFTDEELKAVLTLLAGPGVAWELKFGSWVLLQPERLNAYAQAVLQTMRLDENERGCIMEHQVLSGHLVYHSSMTRLKGDEERFVLLAMHQLLVERGVCLREHTEHGTLLVFPSYYRRERPDLIGHPAVLVSYRFTGFIDEIYATLVVRLHHVAPFVRDKLWRYAADFKTLSNRQLGIKLTRRADGVGELEVYFDSAIQIEEKIIFSKYIHEHLLHNARDVIRLRHYVCPYCGTVVGNREVAVKKLSEGRKDIPCVNCDDPTKRVPLWDEMEELFASADMQTKVNDLQRRSDVILDNQSKQRAFAGEVISTVALAGQVCRELTLSDHGVDMEVEFKSDNGDLTGKKVFLQLKSGDSYLGILDNGGLGFKIDEGEADYWRKQEALVILLTRNSFGQITWTDLHEQLNEFDKSSTMLSRGFPFRSERFDVMSVRHWREQALNVKSKQ